MICKIFLQSLMCFVKLLLFHVENEKNEFLLELVWQLIVYAGGKLICVFDFVVNKYSFGWSVNWLVEID